MKRLAYYKNFFNQIKKDLEKVETLEELKRITNNTMEAIHAFRKYYLMINPKKDSILYKEFMQVLNVYNEIEKTFDVYANAVLTRDKLCTDLHLN